MRSLYHVDFLNILGWSLVDSLWQMGALWLLYSLLTANGKAFSATARYFLALLTVAGGTIWFLAGLLLRCLHVRPGLSYPVELLSTFGMKASLPAYITSMISLVYLAVLIVLAGRLLYHYRSTKRIYTAGVSATPEPLQACLAALQHKLDLVGEISLQLSEKVVTPITIGFIRPVILLPVAAVSQLSLPQLEALIAHELFHIKRHDYLLNLGLAVAGQIFFFNPFARRLIEIARKDREAGCDDAVLQLGYTPGDYARALYTIGKNQGAIASRLAMAAAGKGGKPLLQRIRRILRQPVEPVALGRPLFMLALILLIVPNLKRESGHSHPMSTTVGNTVVAAPAASGAPAPAPTAGSSPELEPALLLNESQKDAIARLQDGVGAPRKKAADHGSREPDRQAIVLSETTQPDTPDRQTAQEPDGELMNTTHYVSGLTKPVAFAMPEKKPAVPPEQTPLGRTLPYVPASTFYYPERAPVSETDSSGRQSIRL